MRLDGAHLTHQGGRRQLRFSVINNLSLTLGDLMSAIKSISNLNNASRERHSNIVFCILFGKNMLL